MNLARRIGYACCGILLGMLVYVHPLPDPVTRVVHIKRPSLEQRLEEQEAHPSREKYALIIAGSTENEWGTNISRCYTFLKHHKFKEKNIVILSTHGQYPEFDFPVQGQATKKNIGIALDELKKFVDGDDVFLLYVSDHGWKGEDESNIYLSEKESVSESELESFLHGLDPGVGILLFDQCYGGEFAEHLGKGKFIGIAASKEKGWSNSFSPRFFEVHDTPAVGDSNGDGKLTLGEAYEYVLRTSEYYSPKQNDPKMRQEAVFAAERKDARDLVLGEW